MSPKDYGIGIAYGLGIDECGKPEIHSMNKLRKLNDMLYSGEVERGIIAVGSLSEATKELVLGLEFEGIRFDPEKIYEDMGRSTVHHMYNIRRLVDRWMRSGEIPTHVLLYHITHTWAAPRFKFDAGWVIADYRSEIVEVEDGRPEDVIKEVDTNEEPKRMKYDKMASKVPILSAYRPDLAQAVVSWPRFILEEKYRKRVLPL